MKKYLTVLALCLLSLGLLTGCSSNGPEDAIKKQMEFLKKKDAKGIVDCIYLEDIEEDPEELEKGKAWLVSMLEKEYSKEPEYIKIKSYEILDVDVSDNPEPGSIAFVTVKITYENGKEEENRTKVIMDKSGTWKIPFIQRR